MVERTLLFRKALRFRRYRLFRNVLSGGAISLMKVRSSTKTSSFIPFLLLLLTMSFLIHCGGGLRRETNKAKEVLVERRIEGRTYFLYRPASFKQDGSLVLALHGGGGEAAGMAAIDKGSFRQLADEKGFIVAYPQGVDKGWNDDRGVDINTAHKENIDDVKFLEAVVNDVAKQDSIDMNHVYITGISNGGFMSLRVACDSTLFSGVAIVTASLPEKRIAPCKNQRRKVPLLFLNGTEDPLVPYDGGDVKFLLSKRGKILSTPETVEYFRKQYDCSEMSLVRTIDEKIDDETTVEIYQAKCPNTKLGLYKILGGGHTWPAGIQYLPESLIGRVSEEIQGSRVIWEFFESIQ